MHVYAGLGMLIPRMLLTRQYLHVPNETALTPASERNLLPRQPVHNDPLGLLSAIEIVMLSREDYGLTFICT